MLSQLGHSLKKSVIGRSCFSTNVLNMLLLHLGDKVPKVIQDTLLTFVYSINFLEVQEVNIYKENTGGSLKGMCSQAERSSCHRM